MSSEEFVDAIKTYVRDAAIRNVMTICSKPPGRSPEKELVEASRWYNSLEELLKKSSIKTASEKEAKLIREERTR